MPMFTFQGLAFVAASSLFLAYCTCSIVRKSVAQRPLSAKYNRKYRNLQVLSVLYETGQQNLISFKDGQWSTTNYSLIAIAAVVAVFSLVRDAHVCDSWSKYAASLAVVLVAGYATVLVTDLQLGIRANRVAINQIKLALFSNGIPGYAGLHEATIEADRRFFRSAELPVLFYASIVIGCALSFLIIVVIKK